MKLTKESLQEVLVKEAKKHMIVFDINSFERDYPSLSLTIYAAMAESYMDGYKRAGQDAINILKETNEKP